MLGRLDLTYTWFVKCGWCEWVVSEGWVEFLRRGLMFSAGGRRVWNTKLCWWWSTSRIRNSNWCFCLLIWNALRLWVTKFHEDMLWTNESLVRFKSSCVFWIRNSAHWLTKLFRFSTDFDDRNFHLDFINSIKNIEKWYLFRGPPPPQRVSRPPSS